jgi:hypothetical protein
MAPFSPTLPRAQGRLLKIREDYQFGVFRQLADKC